MQKNNKHTNQYKPSVVGVDFGSIYTKIAAVDKGAVDIITNQANLRQTPTVVGYGNKERLIGQAGNIKLKSNYVNTIVSPNRYLAFGQSQYITQQNKLALCPSKIADQNQFFKVKCQGNQQRFVPEQVNAAFINKIHQIIDINKLNNKNLTVSVPNYLSQSQRQALLDSILIAKQSSQLSYGFNLINQSTAVGLDYGYYKRNQFSQKEEQGKNVMFIDLGYSKLSLYVIKFTKNYQKMIYQKHLRQFGCKNLDLLMLEFYTTLFESKNQNLQTSIKQNKKATLKLLQNIEKQRRVLSGISQYDFNIQCLLEDNDLSYSMTKQEFEKIISPAVHQIISFFEQARLNIKQNNISISSIQLLGGGSRIPVVMKTINQIFEMEFSRTLNSSESIARGAALYSAMNSGIFRMQDYHSIDLSPHHIQCKWKGQTQEMENQVNTATILNEGQYCFSKKIIQLSLNINKAQLFEIYYPNSIRGLNKEICTFKINFPESQQIYQKKINLCIQFNSNQMLYKVTASSLLEKEISLNILDLSFSKHISQSLMKEYIQKQRQLLLKDYKMAQFYENKNKFQSTFFSIKQKVKSSVNTHKQFINPEIYSQFLAYFDQVQNTFEEINNFQQKMRQIKQKQDKYYKQIQNNKNKQKLIDEQLNKLIEFINNVVGGKVRNVKFYPGEEVNKVKLWVKQKQEELKKQPKYHQPVLTKEEIKQVLEGLMKKIEEYQQQVLKKQRQQQQQYQYQQKPSFYQNSTPKYQNFRQNGYNDGYNSTFDNFYGRPTRKGRNNGYNNTGFFSGFPGFF